MVVLQSSAKKSKDAGRELGADYCRNAYVRKRKGAGMVVVGQCITPMSKVQPIDLPTVGSSLYFKNAFVVESIALGPRGPTRIVLCTSESLMRPNREALHHVDRSCLGFLGSCCWFRMSGWSSFYMVRVFSVSANDDLSGL